MPWEKFTPKENLRAPLISDVWAPAVWDTPRRRWPGPPFLTWPEGVEHVHPTVVRQLLHEAMWVLSAPGLHLLLPQETLEATARDRVSGLLDGSLTAVLESVEEMRKGLKRRVEDNQNIDGILEQRPTWACEIVQALLPPAEQCGGKGGEGEDGEEGQGEESEATDGSGGKGGKGTSGEDGQGEGETENEDGEAEGEKPEGDGTGGTEEASEVEIKIVAESETKVGTEGKGAEEAAPEPEPLPGPGKDGQARSRLAQLLPELRHFGTPDLAAGVDPDRLKHLAEKLERYPNADRLLQMIGRLSASAWMPAKRVPSAAREDMRDVTVGDDLSLLLSSELIRFAIPALTPEAYLDLVERRLHILEMEGSEPRGRGPILLAIDVSPSMKGTSSGGVLQRNAWMPGTDFTGLVRLDVARIVALAMVRAAAIQKRSVVLVGFAASVIWARAGRNLLEYLDIQEFLLDADVGGWGTEFDPPLTTLLQAARQYQGADLVVLTDGEAFVSPRVADALRRARTHEGLRLFTLLFGEGQGLEDLSDLTISVKDFATLEGMSREVTMAR